MENWCLCYAIGDIHPLISKTRAVQLFFLLIVLLMWHSKRWCKFFVIPLSVSRKYPFGNVVSLGYRI